MSVRFTKDLSVHTFSEDTTETTHVDEGVFFLVSRLENLTHLLKMLDKLNCQETSYHQFYKQIHPRISSMLNIETPVKEFQSSDASSKQIQLDILEKIQKLREKNWELCDHFDRKYTPVSPKFRPRLMAVKSLEDLRLDES